MYFSDKKILDKKSITINNVESLMEQTFGSPNSDIILDNISLLSNNIMTQFSLVNELDEKSRTVLLDEINRDLGATVLSIMSEVIDTADWNLPYEKMNPSKLYPTSDIYEKPIEDLVQNIIKNLPERVSRHEGNSKFLAIKLSIALNNEACQKEKGLNTEIKNALEPTNPLLTIKDIFLSYCKEEAKDVKADEVLALYIDIIEKSVDCSPELYTSVNGELLASIKRNIFEDLVSATYEIHKETMADVENTEESKVLIPNAKTPSVLKVSPDDLHEVLHDNIDKLHELCIEPHISLLAVKELKAISEYDSLENSDDLMKYPELIKLYTLTQVSSLNLHTAIHDCILKSISISAEIINEKNNKKDILEGDECILPEKNNAFAPTNTHPPILNNDTDISL